MPHLSDFSALLFDVDGTLSNLDYEITSPTRSALENLQKTGVTTGICTGRHYAQMGEYVLGNFPADTLHVVSGGAQIITQDGQVLWQKGLDAKFTRELIQAAQEEQLGFLTHDGKYSYATADVQAWFKPSLPGGWEVQPLSELSNFEVPMAVVYQPTPSFLTFLDQHPEFEYKQLVSKKHGQYLDITARGVNKAFGLAKWSELTNIQFPKIIGFGDSNNDIEFLQSVGWSVGMGNATPEIQAIAKKLIGHVDQNGLANYLQSITAGAAL